MEVLSMENFDNLLKAVDGLEQKIAKLEEIAKEANNKLLNALKTAKPVSKYGVSEESCMKFIKLTRALLAGDIAEAKVVSGASPATGGYLIPTEVAGTILSIVHQYSVALRYSTIFPMGSKNVNIPKAIANLYDYVVDEGVSLTPVASGNLFGVVPLSAKRHGSIVPITNDMIESASVNVVDFLMEEIARALAKGTDSITFLGTTSAGTTVSSMPGILANEEVTAVTTSTTAITSLKVKDLDDCIASVDSSVLDGARFFMNTAVLYGVVANLKENTGENAGLIYQPATGDRPAMWRGFPIETVSCLPSSGGANTKFIAFGNLKYNIIGRLGELSYDTAREATIIEGSTTYNLWQQGMQAIKLEEMIDIKVAFPTAFAYIKTASS